MVTFVAGRTVERCATRATCATCSWRGSKVFCHRGTPQDKSFRCSPSMADCRLISLGVDIPSSRFQRSNHIPESPRPRDGVYQARLAETRVMRPVENCPRTGTPPVATHRGWRALTVRESSPRTGTGRPLGQHVPISRSALRFASIADRRSAVGGHCFSFSWHGAPAPACRGPPC